MPSTSDFSTILSRESFKLLKELANELQVEVFLVGGALRDFLLGVSEPTDLDFFVVGHPSETLAKRFSDRVGGHYVLLDEDFGIHRVVVKIQNDSMFQGDGTCGTMGPKEITFDFSDALDNDLQKDLSRRDLTINAFALSLKTGAFYDPFQGVADLKAKRICQISSENMREDPLRLLRVFRLAAHLKTIQIDPQTRATITKECYLLNQVAAERVQYEFLRFLRSSTEIFPLLKEMADTGLLEVILPELALTRQVPSNDYHHLGLFEHTLELVNQVEQLVSQLPNEVYTRLTLPFSPTTTRMGLIKLACLLHDIGKPQTMVCHDTLPPGDRQQKKVTFYGHDVCSETMAEAIARRLKFSHEVMIYLKKLVRWHLYPCQFGPESSRKSVLKFFRRMGSDTPDLILLALADRYSTRGPVITPEIFQKSVDAHWWLLDQYEKEQNVLTLPPLVNGHEVMAWLDLGPGPQIKTWLEAVQEAYQLGEISTKEDAKAWLFTQNMLQKI